MSDFLDVAVQLPTRISYRFGQKNEYPEGLPAVDDGRVYQPSGLWAEHHGQRGVIFPVLVARDAAGVAHFLGNGCVFERDELTFYVVAAGAGGFVKLT